MPAHRLYATPEARLAGRRVLRAVKLTRQAGQLCTYGSCTSSRKETSDLCSLHKRRRERHGHPAAGPLASADVRAMVAQVRPLLKPGRGITLDAQLAQDALAVMQNVLDVPPDLSAGLRRELYRLASPPAPPRFQYRYGRPILNKTLPVTAHEALVTVLSHWCLALIPGAVTSSGRGRGKPPQFPDEKSIAVLIGGALLNRRQRKGTITQKVKLELGRLIVQELAPMMDYVTSLVSQRMAASVERVKRKIAKRQIATAPTPTPPARLRLEF